MPLEAYMEACNTYYYATRDPLGSAGDFTTAPEISQMFGEMVGAALADCWARAGKPSDAIYAELGPGRGTLASDAARVMRSAGFEGGVHMVENSPVLRDAQREAVPEAIHHETIADLPDGPLLLVANEFFDALPIRQLANGIERRVMVMAGGLAFDRDGAITEVSPAREEAGAGIAKKLEKNGGVAIVIDYGHAETAPGDTLQAVRRHKFTPVLADPGEQDLTSHVDFEALAKAANNVSVTQVVTQGDWLRRLGIEARAEALVSANPDKRDDVRVALYRLTAPDQMGDLFKVMAIHSPDWPVPAGFA
jgi:NADH dehydrogenase [ubiquinone] 1 alpha subcomplex assembly factor 7